MKRYSLPLIMLLNLLPSIKSSQVTQDPFDLHRALPGVGPSSGVRGRERDAPPCPFSLM